LKHYQLLRRRAGQALALCLLVIVASCTSRPQQSVMQDYKPPASKASPVAANQPTPQPAVVKKTPEPVAEKSAPAAPVIAVPAAPKVAIISPPAKPEAVTPPPPPLPTTRDVLGLKPLKVSQMLGQPGLIRREKPAEVWQYAGSDCVLHVFLYDDEPSGTFRVDHLEATDLQGAMTSTDSCLAEMVKKP